MSACEVKGCSAAGTFWLPRMGIREEHEHRRRCEEHAKQAGQSWHPGQSWHSVEPLGGKELTGRSLETVLAEEGKKLDKGKPRWSLLQWDVLGEVVKVLEHGARKYAPENWRKVPDARQRYYDAAMRHLTAWWMGEDNDDGPGGSGLPHLAHALCCLSFLLALDLARLAASPKA